MRLLVDGRSLTPGDRLECAALGLALRGHDVRWLGEVPELAAGAPRWLTEVPRAQDASGVDLVLGSGRAPVPIAVAGWLAGAHGMVLDVPEGAERRWGLLGRIAWGALDAIAFRDSGVETTTSDDPDWPAERFLSWPAAEAPAEPEPEHADVEALERACERLIARRRGFAKRAAVFLDRDGTLVVEVGYLSDPNEIQLLPGVGEALRALRAGGYALVVVSNQSGVGRGLFPLSRVYEAMARLRGALRAHGVELDAIHFCPHRPDAGCPCRKPATELLKRAAEDLNLALHQSVMVGDKLLDVATGHAAGMKGVLVRTGYGKDEERRDEGRPPDLIAEDLASAVPWILERHPG